ARRAQEIVGVEGAARQHEVGIGKELYNLLHHRVKAARRNLIVQERMAGSLAVAGAVGQCSVSGAVRGGRGGREIAEALARGRNVSQARDAPVDARAFVVKEEERAVPDDGPAHVTAELVLSVLGLLRAGAVQEEVGAV